MCIRDRPLDGGRYAGTGDAVITRDPDTGYLNIGTYRMMQQGKAEVGLYLSPGKDARLHITRAWQRGKSIEVAAAWGIDPLFMLVGSQTFPKNVSEYEFAGGIKGQPIPVVRGTTTDLLIPANAELVIEGVHTTIPLQRRIFRDADFIAGRVDTTWVERVLLG